MVNFIALVFFIILVTVLYTVFYGAPFVVTDRKTVKRVVELSGVEKGDKVVDLGSGDGRIVIAFAKLGVEAHGYEINPLLVLLSLIKLRALNLKKARFYLSSFWKINLTEYDIVVVYGISYIMTKLEDKLEKELKKGTKVITHAYKLPTWKIQKSEKGVFFYVK